MLLELTITSYQRLSPTVTSKRSVEPGQTVVVGRSPDCDWHLPDPARVLSSRHAEFYFVDGGFVITDTSTNGVFVNGSESPLGRGNVAAVADGDVLRLGDFELSVAVRSGAGQAESSAGDALTDLPQGSSGKSDPLLVGGIDSSAGTAFTEESGSATAAEFRDFIEAGLGERVMADSHVMVQEPEIPGEWHWGQSGVDDGTAKPQESAAPVDSTADNSSAGPEVLSAIFEGLGLRPEQVKDVGPQFGLQLGALTRVLLDRLLDMIQVRARQKQQLRVAQTLFQRSENNPLKFSATPQDALDSLLLRPHAANLGPTDAVNRAFDDLVSHEQALLKGVEAVVQDLLSDPADMPEPSGVAGIWARRRVLETVQRHRDWQRDVYGSTDKMLRSDVFVEAYEEAVGQNKETAGV